MVVLQWILVVAFTLAGIMKLTRGKKKLQDQMQWVNSFTDPVVRFIGAAELAGAIGLALPLVTDISANLAVAAAIGLLITMVGAQITHARRKDGAQDFVPSGVLGILLIILLVGIM